MDPLKEHFLSRRPGQDAGPGDTFAFRVTGMRCPDLHFLAFLRCGVEGFSG